MEFHGHQEFAREVETKRKGLSIVADRYQEASLLSFYLREKVPVLTVNGRKSQYDLWNDIERYEGQTVMFLSKSQTDSGDVYHPYFGWYELKKRHLDIPF